MQKKILGKLLKTNTRTFLHWSLSFLLELSRTLFQTVGAERVTQHYSLSRGEKGASAKKSCQIFVVFLKTLFLRSLSFSSMTCESPMCDWVHPERVQALQREPIRQLQEHLAYWLAQQSSKGGGNH